MSKKLYFCTSCRKKIPKVDQLLFVEESKRGFCSEDCIVEFFSPYMKSLDAEEVSFRESLGLEPEIDAVLFQDKSLFEEALYNPKEVWLEKNDLQEEYYTHITPISDNKFFILICSYYEGEPAFVFFKTITSSVDLVQFYKRDSLVEGERGAAEPEAAELDVMEEISLPSEIVEDIDLKKSEHLASLLERRKETDISFEEYGLYDDYITLTLDDPDDEFQSEDNAGDSIYTFIKSFQKEGQAFFYIVICLRVNIPGGDDSALMPVITFPSIDDDLYTFYAVGDKKNKRITN